MANNKKTTYMTVDQIRKQERENRFKNLKFDDDKVYSVDEIRQAAINQGVIKPPEPAVQAPSAQPAPQSSWASAPWCEGRIIANSQNAHSPATEVTMAERILQ